MKKILSLLCLSLVVISCTDDDIRTDHQIQNGPKIVGFSSNFATVAYFEDTGAVERTFPLALIGSGNGQTNASNIEVTYEIDTAASTATEGVEFDLVDQSGKITIPAGATFGEFPLLVNTGSLNPSMKTQLILKLKTTSEGVIGAGYETLRIVFVGCQTTIATASTNGSFNLSITRNDGNTYSRPSETLYLVDVNTLKTSSVGHYAAGSIAPDTGFNFIDICGEITVPKQGLCQGYYSNQVYGLTSDGTDGAVTSVNNFNLKYEITFASGNRQYTNIYVRN